MKTSTTCILATAVTLLLLLPGVPFAGEPSASVNFSGTFKSTLTKKQARAKIDESIDDIVDDMAFYKRPFARSILENRTPPCLKLEITLEDDEVALTCDGRRPARAPVDGTRHRFKPTDGDPVDLSYEMKGAKLIQKFYGENGVRTNTYRLAAGGEELRLDVEIRSSKMPRPLRYKRVFRRR